MKRNVLGAALFDLDGVVFDTEPQYTQFWGQQCRLYHPETPGLEYEIKGQTLTQIFDRLFSGGLMAERDVVTRRLNEFEQQMHFDYIPGFEAFVADLRRHGVRTAVVTSSNQAKMNVVYQFQPHFRSLFDAILTSEDFAESKPSPDCYLKAAGRFGLDASECVVFEDSFNGLKSGRAAQMVVVGLTTGNPADAIAPYSDHQMADYQAIDYEKLSEIVGKFAK